MSKIYNKEQDFQIVSLLASKFFIDTKLFFDIIRFKVHTYNPKVKEILIKMRTIFEVSPLLHF